MKVERKFWIRNKTGSVTYSVQRTDFKLNVASASYCKYLYVGKY